MTTPQDLTWWTKGQEFNIPITLEGKKYWRTTSGSEVSEETLNWMQQQREDAIRQLQQGLPMSPSIVSKYELEKEFNLEKVVRPGEAPETFSYRLTDVIPQQVHPFEQKGEVFQGPLPPGFIEYGTYTPPAPAPAPTPTGQTDTRKYIQDPNNPYASIPNPNYGKAQPTAPKDTTSKYIQDPNNPNASIPNPNYIAPVVKPVVPTTEVPPEVPPETPITPTVPEVPTDQEKSLMDLYGVSLEEIRSPDWLSKKIDEVQAKITAVTTDLEREQPIQDLVKLMAALGLAYPADVIAALSKSPDKAEEEIRTELYEKYGISDLETKFKDRPEKAFEDIYGEIYGTLELAQLKTDIDKIRAKIDKQETDFNKTLSAINEDPWLIEASRSARTKRASDTHNRIMANLNNQLTIVTNMYNRGKEEAENVATRTLQQFAQEKEWEKEELDYYIKRAEADIEAKMKVRVTEAEKEKYRYYPEYVKAYKKPAKEYEPPTSYQEWTLAGKPGTYENWLAKKEKVPTGITGANYNTRLNQEISNLYAGRYGTEGAREKVLKLLKAEFPNVDVSKDVYTRIPDGYEKQIKILTETLSDEEQIFVNRVQAAINEDEITFEEAIKEFPLLAKWLKP